MNIPQASLLSAVVTYFNENPEKISSENILAFLEEKNTDLTTVQLNEVYRCACASLFVHEIEEEVEPAKYAGVVKGDRIN